MIINVSPGMLTVPKQYQEAENVDSLQYEIYTGYQMYLSSVELLCIFSPSNSYMCHFGLQVFLRLIHDKVDMLTFFFSPQNNL